MFNVWSNHVGRGLAPISMGRDGRGGGVGMNHTPPTWTAIY